MAIPVPYTALPRAVPTLLATDLITAGTLQLVVACPNCGGLHRHLGPGLRRSPCGVHYVLETPASKPTAA